MDGRITYVRDSIAHSNFIYTETQNQFFYEPLNTVVGCRIPFNDWSEYHIIQHEGSTFRSVRSYCDSPEKLPCQPVFYVSEIHQLRRVHAWMC